MNPMPLSDFVRVHTQAGAGKLLGCTQGHINKVLRENRKIFVYISDGKFEAVEHKRFPKPRD